MKKIPVGATVAHAYRFAFGNFLKILGVMWLPWLLLMVPNAVIFWRMTAAFSAGAAQDPAAILHMLPLLLVLYPLMLLMLFMQFAGLTRLALGLPMPSPYFYVSLGKPVWRLVAAFLLILLIIIGFAIVAGIVIGILGAIVAVAARGTSAAVAGLAAIAASLVIYGALVYGLVRLGFLLNPVVIAEERIGLRRAWQLGKGNFWRAFAVLLALFLPLGLLELAWFAGPWGPGFVQPLPPNPTPEQIAAFQASMSQWLGQFIHPFAAYWYVILPLLLAISVLVYGAVVAAQAYAYRAVTDGTAIEAD